MFYAGVCENRLITGSASSSYRLSASSEYPGFPAIKSLLTNEDKSHGSWAAHKSDLNQYLQVI